MAKTQLKESDGKLVRFALAVGLGILAFGLLYRTRLFYNLYFASPPYRAFVPAESSFWLLLGSLWHELAWAVNIAALVWVAIYIGSRWSLPKMWRMSLQGLGLAILHLAFVGMAFLYVTHLRVMFAMQSGLTYDMWIEGLAAFAPEYLWSFMSMMDISFLLAPIALFWGFWWLLPHLGRWCLPASSGLAGLLLLLGLLPSVRSERPLDAAARMTPVQFLLQDYRNTSNDHTDTALSQASTRPSTSRLQHKSDIKGATKHTTRQGDIQSNGSDKADGSAVPPPTTRVLAPSLLGSISTAWAHRTQADTVRLIDPLFARPLSLIRSHKGLDISALPSFMSHFLADADPDQATASPKRPPLNLLLLILESVGTRYIADQSRGNPVPMPFLHSLTQRGWFWANHFSTANSSPPALFSIFTGLYPVPRMQMFVMRRDVYLPALTGFLGPDYDSFMYTPTSLRWYFPQAFFANTGPHELVGANKFRNVKKFGSFPNEIDVIKAFVQRLKRAKEPFFGTYFSFIPHGPYDDYGPKYRIFKDIKRDINRYFNNLHLLDILLRKLFDELESSGLIDRTLVVIVGDHGQAFGQQRGNWGHSRASYNVNYHSPVIFYQPRLIKPRRITRYTSHVDLLPTILDFMGIKYNTELLQGESILQSSFWRRQIFIYGNEHMLSSIDEQQIKLQYSYKYRRCWVYDLRNDPDERERLNCAAYKEQHRALELFYRLQPNLIEQYNKVSREGRDFQGLRHPSFTRKP